ncbi:hypothetical protein HanIR_Chr16g0843021 [Helianthus annuus]|nr:hypothetical protein HanIR_Chr16g0843021 [Helianthus annuus]
MHTSVLSIQACLRLIPQVILHPFGWCISSYVTLLIIVYIFDFWFTCLCCPLVLHAYINDS